MDYSKQICVQEIQGQILAGPQTEPTVNVVVCRIPYPYGVLCSRRERTEPTISVLYYALSLCTDKQTPPEEESMAWLAGWLEERVCVMASTTQHPRVRGGGMALGVCVSVFVLITPTH